MTAVMAYRGPDDVGFYEDGEVLLGYRRLSMLDLSKAGHQPMQSGDGQLVITYNGEIGRRDQCHQAAIAAKPGRPYQATNLCRVSQNLSRSNLPW
jgi:asparagine synthetase B (glutamine-hydrolysing)